MHASRLAPCILLIAGCATGNTPGAFAPEPRPLPGSNEKAADASSASACEVEVRTSAALLADGGYELSTTLTNRTDRELRVAWAARCPGPGVSYEGLPSGYDYGATCVAGACAGGASEVRELILAPFGTEVAARVLVSPRGDACNAPLPGAPYLVSASLTPLGVRTCTGGQAAITLADQPPETRPALPVVLEPARPAPRKPAPRKPAPPTQPEEPCPAMACAYEPCPPGVEPPSGCGSVCGCAGMRGAAPQTVTRPP